MKADERIKLREVPAGVDANIATREKSKAEELEALLEAHRGERHIIVLQSFSDPDAISSAFAHQMIAARHDIECDIAYDGRVSHHENIALIEILQLHLLRVGESDDLKRYQGSVFIDTQGTTSGLTERLRDARVPALAIIDHHEPQGWLERGFQTSATARTRRRRSTRSIRQSAHEEGDAQPGRLSEGGARRAKSGALLRRRQARGGRL